jgi:hypothetical protein
MADEETASAVIASLLDTYFGGADRSELLQAAGLDNVGVDGNSELQEEEQQAAQALLSALAGDSALVRAEASRVTGTEYDRKATRVIVRRGESRLVARYRQTLDDDDDDGMRLRLAVGYTDLYRVQHGDLIEAKVSAEHRYVRQALGQLLDYAAHCTHPLNRLTALFPQVLHPRTYGSSTYTASTASTGQAATTSDALKLQQKQGNASQLAGHHQRGSGPQEPGTHGHRMVKAGWSTEAPRACSAKCQCSRLGWRVHGCRP